MIRKMIIGLVVLAMMALAIPVFSTPIYKYRDNLYYANYVDKFLGVEIFHFMVKDKNQQDDMLDLVVRGDGEIINMRILNLESKKGFDGPMHVYYRFSGDKHALELDLDVEVENIRDAIFTKKSSCILLGYIKNSPEETLYVRVVNMDDKVWNFEFVLKDYVEFLKESNVF